MKTILTKFVPELNPSCLYYLDCLRPPVVCAECKLKNDPFVDMSVQKALQDQSRLVLDGSLKSAFYLRMKDCTTADTEYVLPMATHKIIKKVVHELNKHALMNKEVISC